MFKFKCVFISFAILISLLGTSQVTLADSGTPDKTVIFLIDRAAISATQNGSSIVRSAVNLISSLRPDDSFIFIPVDNSVNMSGPVNPKTPQFEVAHEQIYAGVNSPSAIPPSDFVTSLTEAYNWLNSANASSGSMIVLISGSSSNADLFKTEDQLGPTLNLLKSNGWPVMGLSLPNTSRDVSLFLNNLAVETEGNTIELSPPEGFKSLAESMLSDASKGSLAQVESRILSPNEVLISPLNIAPGTRNVTLMFFKADTYGSVKLMNPLGSEATGDRDQFKITRTPYVIIWDILSPTPGEWTTEIQGVQGQISSWKLSSNKYKLDLVSYGAVPLNDPNTLIAYVMDGDTQVNLRDVEVIAKITTPAGRVLAHQLNDEGHSGDSYSNDGYYSGIIPPLSIEGSYDVELHLIWPTFGHGVTSQTKFEGLVFPTIDVNRTQTEEIKPGERTKIATVSVHIGGEPYSIPTNLLISQVASNIAEGALLEVTPQRLLSENRAWIYDVFITANGQGLHTVNFQLGLEYAGRQYTYASEVTVLSSIIVTPPVIAVTVPSQPLPITSFPITAAGSQTSNNALTVIYLLGIALLSLSGAAAIHWFTRKSPYGYLYNDRDEPIADFSKINRSVIRSFLFKDFVRGKELGITDLDDVSFKFFRDKIGISCKPKSPSVRINNQPLVDQTMVYETAWIGTAGRLYSLFLDIPPFELEYAKATD